jgi:FGGY-family pentulose kinase
MVKGVVAVDVGTSSARSGVYDAAGRLLGRAQAPIALRREDAAFAVHASDDIWRAVGQAVRGAVAEADIAPGDVAAIGFDATCSLVVLDSDGRGLPVARDGGTAWDTIAWLDHRADAEAERLSASGHPMVARLGGAIASEMQLPKLMWLKAHRPDLWRQAGLIFDLADFLTFRACGSARRSVATLSAKWAYPAERAGWDDSLLAVAGLEDLRERAGMHHPPGTIGEVAGHLTPDAAAHLGLTRHCSVAFGQVDAFAGALALLGPRPNDQGDAALIGGTSSCLMRLSDRPETLPHFWGPFRDAVLPGLWATEGGQSATGALLDHLIRIHGGGLEPTAATHERIIARIGEGLALEGTNFGRGLHVLPDFHGNRTPLGQPAARGAVIGLPLDASFDALSRLYWRAMVGIAMGIRQIVEVWDRNGPRIERLHLGGGHVRNPLMTALYADATGREVHVGAGEEAMLVGTAMVAAATAGLHADVAAAARAMERDAVIHGADAGRRQALDNDYRAFLALQAHCALYTAS